MSVPCSLLYMQSASSFTSKDTHQVFVQNHQLYLHGVDHDDTVVGHMELENTIVVAVWKNIIFSDLTGTIFRLLWTSDSFSKMGERMWPKADRQ